jgi:hypothetical protein
MLIVITVNEKDSRTGVERLVVSHGIDESTGKTVILPSEHPSALGAVFDADLGEYVIDDDVQRQPPSPFARLNRTPRG